MASGQLGSALRTIHRLFAEGSVTGVSDGEILERYLSRGDEAAFEALVARHGPMVLAVCRRTLDDRSDLDDTFQATFLVLARRARSVRDRVALGDWLYGVARRVCLLANRSAARRRRHERQAAERRKAREVTTVANDELGPVIDEEIERLPAPYRLPTVLCLLEGKTQSEAAAELRWSEGMVRGRLGRAKQRLRARLIRRGLAPAATLAALAREGVGAGALPSALIETAARAAVGGGVSASAAALTQELINTMLLKTVMLSATLFVAGAIALAASAALIPGGDQTQSDRPREVLSTSRTPRLPAAQPDPTPPNRVGIALVLGQVLDPDGKAAPGARVAVVHRSNATRQSDNKQGGMPLKPLGMTRADAEGRFRLEVPRESLDLFPTYYALATVEGHGFGIRSFDPGLDRQELTIRLTPDQVIHGRLFDLQGQPAAHVTVDVTAFGNESAEGNEMVSSDLPLTSVSLWPAAATSDDQGRYTLRGIGRFPLVVLHVRGAACADQSLVVRSDKPVAVREVSHALAPAMIMRGRVTLEDTGAPMPGARLVIHKGSYDGWTGPGIAIDADADGRYRVNLPPYEGEGDDYNGYLIWCYPSGDTPYIGVTKELKWPKAKRGHTLDFALPRGQYLRGKVTERPSGRPVAGASLIYSQRLHGNKDYRDNLILGWDNAAVSGPDGTFRATVMPGLGHLSVYGPTLDYVYPDMGSFQIFSGKPGGSRMFAHAWAMLDLKPGEDRDVPVTLQRGVTVHARIVGPDGRTDPDAMVHCILNQHPGIVRHAGYGLPARGGRFEFTGCDPERPVTALVFDYGRRLGTTVTISGTQAGEELTIRLAPCGSAWARFVDEKGQPLVSYTPHPMAVLAPGPRSYVKPPQRLLATEDQIGFPAPSSPKAYKQREQTDSEGRVTLYGLVPGATYRIGGAADDAWREFTVATGQTVDLGDVTIKDSE
ncbi:RNA polymerase sigma factor, sigma-70 family [Singulisphaera sp. GP187]|uniref:sigma-70 family RNA polymerase sigma factor n=1 Tax=Singulisphaera sp. GP187 TaxID=1882752 RepID=UPI000928DE82|nr:sigma-70 family RNA polymerase sigma factor [Singulisphaera sp. GP187]SIO58787.1 RNA polymerase sigma factor, sigma-70 family [Singulisphaera sp. GP187]